MPFFTSNNQLIKVPAAWLIEQCSLKGIKQNGVGIYPKHALVIVNYSSSSGKPILKLSQHIQDTVYKKFGIRLEPEVNII